MRSMSLLDTFLSDQLQKRKKENALRSLKQPSGLVDFTSNDYLGMAKSPELNNLILERVRSHNLKYNGATGSRLLSGNSVYTEEVEHKLTEIFKGEASLIFNSGYTANTAVLSSIPQKGDTIIYDEFAHTSIKDGARLSLANRFSFKHNNLDHLEQKLKNSTGKIFIAVESIYSMDGDECPLHDLVILADKYGAFLILDEAHSTGVLGDFGSGMAVALGLEDRIAVRIYTFGKAMGCHGACVVGTKDLIQYLINFSRPFIYTTALPPHSIATIDCAFDFLSQNLGFQLDLQKKIDLFTSLIKDSLGDTGSNSAIQAIIIPGNENTKNTAHELQKDGFDIRPILSPTVVQGHERLRICLHSYNTDVQIIRLSKLLIELKKTTNL